MLRRSIVQIMWAAPVIKSVELPAHAQSSPTNTVLPGQDPMAQSFYNYQGSASACPPGGAASDYWEEVTYRNESSHTAVLTKFEVVNSNIWDAALVPRGQLPMIIHPKEMFTYSRRLFTPAPLPIPDGGTIKVMFEDGSVLTIPANGC